MINMVAAIVMLMATNSTHSANPSLIKNLPYDPVKDFAPVARAGSYIFVLAVNKDVPAKSLQELIAYAKANPGKLSYASGNTTGIVAGETFKRWAGIDLLHVHGCQQARGELVGVVLPAGTKPR